MKIQQQLAKHLRELYFGGNWTCSDFKSQLDGINWNQAVEVVKGMNPIAALVFHSGYYVDAVIGVFNSEELNSKDADSFNFPPVRSQADWEQLIQHVLSQADKLASQVENMPEDMLWKTFVDEKYGTYFRNLMGVIEHSHYHLGQIALLKKMLQKQNT